MSPYRSLPVDYLSQAQAVTYEVQATGADGRPGKPIVGMRTTAELASWLSMQSSRQHATTGPKTILRLIHAYCEVRPDLKDPSHRRFSVTLPEPLCWRLHRDLGLPINFQDHLGEVSDRVLQCGGSTVGTSSYIINYKADPEDTGCMFLALTSCPQLATTSALLLTTRRIPSSDLEPIIANLLPTIPLPLSLITVLTSLQIDLAVEATEAVDSKLTELETHNASILLSLGAVPGPEDLSRTAAVLHQVRFTLGRAGRRLANLSVLFDLHAQQHDAQTPIRSQIQAIHDTAATTLATHVANQRRDVQHLQHQATNAETRVQTQREAVFQYMSQREASTARSIAAATMRDGAAMKALALLTTVFLPGTYLATMFSMPIVDWDRARNLPGGAFGLYWIVTVSLTGIVLGIWGVWTWRGEIRGQRMPRLV